MQFTLQGTDPGSSARYGIINTAHGSIETPIFMPVGTVGSVKGIFPETLLSEIRAQIILGNTYHLYLRPGQQILKSAGGLHPFMQWDRPVLTDSGGYQVYSLAKRRTLSEEGVEFQSHIDGSRHLFTPESVIDMQRTIGSDIMMVLDECPPGDASYEYALKSNQLTMRWARRSKQAFEATQPLYGNDQALFPIVQGVTYHDIRRQSAEELVGMDFPGYAIGGLSVGEPADVMYEVVERVTPHLPVDKPRYLMGVGTPANLLENVARGIDMFDCVMPTRNGRNGMLFTTHGIINIRNARWAEDHSAIDDGLPCSVSQNFSKAYLRHLFVARELLGLQIASIHNLAFYLNLMSRIREAIASGRFEQFRQQEAALLDRRL